MKVDISESVAAAISGATDLISLIHGQGTSRWMRGIDDKNEEMPRSPNEINEIRRFNVHFNVDRDPNKKVTIMMDVQRILTIQGDEEWQPIYGIIHFYTEGDKCSSIHCIFNPKGDLSLYPGFSNYPYKLMVL